MLDSRFRFGVFAGVDAGFLNLDLPSTSDSGSILIGRGINGCLVGVVFSAFFSRLILCGGIGSFVSSSSLLSSDPESELSDEELPSELESLDSFRFDFDEFGLLFAFSSVSDNFSCFILI